MFFKYCYEKEFFYGTNPAVSLGTPGNTTGRCAPASYGFPVEFFTIDLATGDTTINSPGTSYLKFTNDGKPDSSFIHPNPKDNLILNFLLEVDFQSQWNFPTRSPIWFPLMWRAVRFLHPGNAAASASARGTTRKNLFTRKQNFFME